MRSGVKAYAAAAAVVLAALAVGCRDGGGGEPSQLVAQGDPHRGATAIRKYGCGACHVIPGIRDAQGAVGPPLTAFGRRSFIAGELANNSRNLVRWIELPQSVEPNTAMPILGVTERDARDIAAYLYTLR